MELLIILLIGFGIMWLLIVLPQRRRHAAHERMLSGLAVGDEIVTVGGLYGKLTRLDGDEFRVEVAPGVEVRVARRAVASVRSEEETAAGGESADEVRG